MTKPSRKEMDYLLKTGEKKEPAINNWEDHIKENHTIAYFSTIVKDQLYVIYPKLKGRKNADGTVDEYTEVLIPASEFTGDMDHLWIIAINVDDNVETYRKNVRTVDMIHWKLFSSSTNNSKDDKKDK